MKRRRIPPLGAVPRFIWEEARIKELIEAISRSYIVIGLCRQSLLMNTTN